MSEVENFENLSDSEINKRRQEGRPQKTWDQTAWAVGRWEKWAIAKGKNKNLLEYTKEDLNSELCHFILEIRKKNKKNYPPSSLEQIYKALNRWFKWNKPEINIGTQTEFIKFRQSLNAEMKRLTQSGEFKVSKAIPLTEKEEVTLWDKGILDENDPKGLFRIIFINNGKYFALRGQLEHYNLQWSNFKIATQDGLEFVEYDVHANKTNTGGMRNKPLDRPNPKMFAMTDDEEHCPVRLFKKYKEHAPLGVQYFYCKPIPAPLSNIWFAKSRVGQKTIASVMKETCALAGLEGKRTNHLLKATLATRLYNKHVSEKEIQERTGHKNVDNLRKYQHSDLQHQQDTSHQLNPFKHTRYDTQLDVDMPNWSLGLDLGIPAPLPLLNSQLTPLPQLNSLQLTTPPDTTHVNSPPITAPSFDTSHPNSLQLTTSPFGAPQLNSPQFGALRSNPQLTSPQLNLGQPQSLVLPDLHINQVSVRPQTQQLINHYQLNQQSAPSAVSFSNAVSSVVIHNHYYR